MAAAVTSNPGLTPANFALTNKPGTAASIAVSSGSPQSTKVGTAFAQLLKAIVKDSNGNPVSGVSVTFSAPSQNGASGTFAGDVNTATTDANGIATSVVFTANGNTGGPTMCRRGDEQPGPHYELRPHQYGRRSRIHRFVSGNSQSTEINNAFANPLKVLVKDASNNLLLRSDGHVYRSPPVAPALALPSLVA